MDIVEEKISSRGIVVSGCIYTPRTSQSTSDCRIPAAGIGLIREAGK